VFRRGSAGQEERGREVGIKEFEGFDNVDDGTGIDWTIK
jgi:hypothetical protein